MEYEPQIIDVGGMKYYLDDKNPTKYIELLYNSYNNFKNTFKNYPENTEYILRTYMDSRNSKKLASMPKEDKDILIQILEYILPPFFRDFI